MAKRELGSLPNDIVVEILRRLPVKSLLRFKCVSKFYCETISDPKFSLSIRTQRVALLHKPETDEEAVVPNLDLLDDKGENLPIIPWEDDIDSFLASFYLDLNTSFNRSNVRLLASYNGLLLLSRDDNILLLNPSTRQCRKVLTHPFLDSLLQCCTAGIYYDSYTDDYNVVIGIKPWVGDLDVRVTSFRVKTWKNVEFPFYLSWQSSGPIVNEKIHWLVVDKLSQLCLITYFDAMNDKFVEVPIPDHLKSRDESCILGLGVLDGCLAMTRCDHGPTFPDRAFFDVWAMKVYGAKESWTLLFSMAMRDLEWYSPQPLFFTKEKEVFINVGGEVITICNPEGKLYRDVPLPENTSIENVVTYEESVFFPPDVTKTRGDTQEHTEE